MLPRAFSVILKNLHKFEVSHLNAEMTNINIRGPLSLSYKFLYFSQSDYKMALILLLVVLKWFNKSFFFKTGASVPTYLIPIFGYPEVSLNITFTFLKLFTNGPRTAFQGFMNYFSNLQKNWN